LAGGKTFSRQTTSPQRLKPPFQQSGHYSAEALRHPKSIPSKIVFPIDLFGKSAGLN
jgi:hypothetical protein